MQVFPKKGLFEPRGDIFIKMASVDDKLDSTAIRAVLGSLQPRGSGPQSSQHNPTNAACYR